MVLQMVGRGHVAGNTYLIPSRVHVAFA